jgi:acetamidase/formamidase
MAVHNIMPTRENLHGTFSRDYAPVLTIEDGDSILFQTLDAGWNREPGAQQNAPWNDATRKFQPRDPEKDMGHALCGPVFVRGAAPGMTLEIEIGAIVPGAWGWTAAGGWDSVFNRALGMADKPGLYHHWTLDKDRGRATNQHGHTISLRPFMGVMGNAPDAIGFLSTAPPRTVGGNMDCKELVSGSRLFLPIAVAGALFSVGDGHGAQGDGEASGTAIECPMERVELTFRLRPDMKIETPRAETPSGWITLGFDEDLNQAMFKALNAMLDLMVEQYGLTRTDALALASLAVDLRVTQIVNGVQGVHALLPNGALSVPFVPQTP